jgi:hypothetical protein
VVRVLGAVPSSVTESETTTFRISLLRRPISRRRSATSGLAITVMDTSEVSATAGQYPLSPVYVVAPSSSVSALRRRSRFCSSKKPIDRQGHDVPAWSFEAAVERRRPDSTRRSTFVRCPHPGYLLACSVNPGGGVGLGRCCS